MVLAEQERLVYFHEVLERVFSVVGRSSLDFLPDEQEAGRGLPVGLGDAGSSYLFYCTGKYAPSLAVERPELIIQRVMRKN
jgi:hypothetical protein